MRLAEETPRSGGQPRAEPAMYSPRALFLTALCLLLLFTLASAKGHAQGLGQWARVVQGKVVDSDDKPQPNAVVYLQNAKTQEIKTYITTEDGSYRFGQLSTDMDYQVWAKYQKDKSKTKSISSFDSKKQFIFILKLEPSK
jgi:hypothetical protein